MDTIENPFEKHQELIAYLMLSHMSSFSVNGYLTSSFSYSKMLRTEVAGTLNEQQREWLDIVINNTKRLQDHLGIFIIATRLMFTPDRVYEIECDVLSVLNDVIKHTQNTTDFQIKTEFPNNIPLFKADQNLIHYAIDCMGRIIKQIHPTYKGQINIAVEINDDLVKITFTTETGENIYPVNENPDLFIAQSVAKLHGGEFMVDANDKFVKLIFTLSMTTFS